MRQLHVDCLRFVFALALSVATPWGERFSDAGDLSFLPSEKLSTMNEVVKAVEFWAEGFESGDTLGWTDTVPVTIVINEIMRNPVAVSDPDGDTWVTYSAKRGAVLLTAYMKSSDKKHLTAAITEYEKILENPQNYRYKCFYMFAKL